VLKHKVVLIGASTGGPSQIKELLNSLVWLRSTVVIVQHMREEVLPFFIKDLKDSLKIEVQSTPLMVNFTIPSVIICAESSVLVKESGNFLIKTDKQNQHYTPDINKLFCSFSEYADSFECSVIIMTGIGSDGVDGAELLKHRGAKIFAQDEASSPVYGMPKAAYERGIVDSVKSLQEIKEYMKGI
jgi:two-component system chemotaxis response regulator CheB